MEKSPARVTRDLSAPWLRHSGRDDGLGVAHSSPRSFDCRFAIAPPFISTVGTAGTGMEKSPARDD